LAFSDQLLVLDGDGLIGDGRDETSGKAFYEGGSHFEELVVSSKYVD
jgi:hypothetical protein